MKIGICSANSGPYATRPMLDSLALLAEEAGVESVWVSEHPVLADPREPPWRMDPGDPILDQVTTRAFPARRTRSAGLGTGAIWRPFRTPPSCARGAARAGGL